MRGALKIQLSVLLGILSSSWSFADSVYETQGEFVNRAFPGLAPPASTVWLSGELKQSVKKILGHDYPALRLRYWCRQSRTAWILEEVGKELPITVGIVVDEHHIDSLRVMVYRENRGGEVSTPSFTDQFNGVALEADRTLGKTIDGITGATLSVGALTRLAAMALYLDGHAGCDHGA